MTCKFTKLIFFSILWLKNGRSNNLKLLSVHINIEILHFYFDAEFGSIFEFSQALFNWRPSFCFLSIFVDKYEIYIGLCKWFTVNHASKMNLVRVI